MSMRTDDCARKHRYSDYKLAKQHVRRAARRGETRMQVYTCPQCRGFHIGHAGRTEDLKRIKQPKPYKRERLDFRRLGA